MTNMPKDHHSLHQVAVWIDHREAILAFFEDAHLLRDEELFSEAGSHTHSGGSRSQKRIEAHRHAVLDHFYEEVIHELKGADQILIYGPGQAKHELEHHLSHNKSLHDRVLDIVTTDKLGKHQLERQAIDDFIMAHTL